MWYSPILVGHVLLELFDFEKRISTQLHWSVLQRPIIFGSDSYHGRLG